MVARPGYSDMSTEMISNHSMRETRWPEKRHKMSSIASDFSFFFCVCSNSQLRRIIAINWLIISWIFFFDEIRMVEFDSSQKLFSIHKSHQSTFSKRDFRFVVNTVRLPRGWSAEAAFTGSRLLERTRDKMEDSRDTGRRESWNGTTQLGSRIHFSQFGFTVPWQFVFWWKPMSIYVGIVPGLTAARQ